MVTRRLFTQAALGGGATRQLAALFTGPVAAPAEATGYGRDALHRIPLEQVQLRGVMGAAIDRCIRNRILAQSPDALVEPFRHRNEQNCWQTEFWGKWFLSAASAYRYKQDAELRERLGRSVRSLMATQSPDGYIGTCAVLGPVVPGPLPCVANQGAAGARLPAKEEYPTRFALLDHRTQVAWYEAAERELLDPVVAIPQPYVPETNAVPE